VKIHAHTEIVSDEGVMDVAKAGLVCFNNGEYYGLTERPIGNFGFSL